MKINGTVTFDQNDPIYKVHFPDSPTVPGSLIIESMIQYIKKNFSNNSVKKIESFRFRHFLKPATYKFSIEQVRNEFVCIITGGDTMLAKGKFLS